MRAIHFALLIFPVLGFAQAQASEHERVTVTIIHDDGGKTGERDIRDLLDALGESGCRAVLSIEGSRAPAQLVFDPQPVSMAEKKLPDYRLIARARTVDGELTVGGAVVVHAATGIEDLETLQGKWISFVGTKSWPGYRLPVQMMQQAGIDAENSPFYFVGNHVGSISALLHRDVHVAVAAEPLARRWAGQNGLAIVAVTEKVGTGGWWIHKNVPDSLAQGCVRALLALNRDQHEALPAWIDGFVAP